MLRVKLKNTGRFLASRSGVALAALLLAHSCNPVGESAIQGTLGALPATTCSGAYVTATSVTYMPVSNCFVSRASTARYFDVAGVIQTAAIDTVRVNYDPVTHALGGFLVEPAATNLITNSVAISTNAVWTTNGAYTANSTTAPDGGTAITYSSAIAFAGTYKSVGGLTIGSVYTYSVYVKYLSGSTTVRIGLGAGFADFNSSTGALVGQSGLTGTPSCTSVGSSWYRCQIGFTASAAAHNATMYNRFAAATENAFWGPQVELGTTPTSYITTTGTTATRAADIYRLP